jgi:solute carrier family 25 folate transporter 32
MDFKQKSAIAPLLAGLSAGTASTVLLIPIDNIKVRLQVNEGENGSSKSSDTKRRSRLGAMRIVRGVIRHEGISGFYQGLTPAVLGSAVSWGGFFFVYEGFKQRLRDRKASVPGGDKTLNSWDNFTLACMSGGVMVGITNPVWLIKLRMQLQMKKASQRLKSAHQPYTGMVDAARTIVREEGFWALYKGAGPALLLTSHGGVQFVVYEYLRKHFHYARAQRDSSWETSSVIERLEKSMGYLCMGAIAKM